MILVLTSVLVGQSVVYGEERDCKSSLICFFPNDYLKYSTYLDDDLFWQTTYQHEGFVDEDTIMVDVTDESFDDTAMTFIDGKAVTVTTTGKIVDLRIGILAEEYVGGDGTYNYNYLVIQPSPVDINKWLQSPTSAEYWKDRVGEEKFDFNGKTRTVIVVENDSIKQIIDKETGILLLLENKSPSLSYISVIELNATNILDYSSYKLTSKIPDWVKNNAGWWSENLVDDESFVNGIEYLVQNEIISIPNLSTKTPTTSKEVPVWIKNTADWWSNDKITDDEFLKGIEYLVQHGIISVKIK